MTISPAFGCGAGISRHSNTAWWSLVTIQQVFMIRNGFRGYSGATMLPVYWASAIPGSVTGAARPRVVAFNAP
jgi:hypothetical protein